MQRSWQIFYLVCSLYSLHMNDTLLVPSYFSYQKKKKDEEGVYIIILEARAYQTTRFITWKNNVIIQFTLVRGFSINRSGYWCLMVDVKSIYKNCVFSWKMGREEGGGFVNCNRAMSLIFCCKLCCGFGSGLSTFCWLCW